MKLILAILILITSNAFGQGFVVGKISFCCPIPNSLEGSSYNIVIGVNTAIGMRAAPTVICCPIPIQSGNGNTPLGNKPLRANTEAIGGAEVKKSQTSGQNPIAIGRRAAPPVVTQPTVIDLAPYDKDSTMEMIHSGNGAHNGTCCGTFRDVYIMHWSYKRKQWSLMTDSLFDAYYSRRYPIEFEGGAETIKSQTSGQNPIGKGK